MVSEAPEELWCGVYVYRSRANSLETDSFPAVKMATISSCLLEIGNYFSRVSAVKIASIIYSHK
jgi:hypothetical protein